VDWGEGREVKEKSERRGAREKRMKEVKHKLSVSF